MRCGWYSVTIDYSRPSNETLQVPRLAFVNKLDRMGANPHNGIKGICDILKLNAVGNAAPNGLEEDHAGVIDPIRMKANYFDGEHGMTFASRKSLMNEEDRKVSGGCWKQYPCLR
ncbi:MAG: hypothetical protein CM1200mP28_10860 [Deltaproteobacteria bacterium]|nr:MAG: hypothetical protein CM1200mP28_10860 [Deltaproteobacteria bacterium]